MRTKVFAALGLLMAGAAAQAQTPSSLDMMRSWSSPAASAGYAPASPHASSSAPTSATSPGAAGKPALHCDLPSFARVGKDCASAAGSYAACVALGGTSKAGNPMTALGKFTVEHAAAGVACPTNVGRMIDSCWGPKASGKGCTTAVLSAGKSCGVDYAGSICSIPGVQASPQMRAFCTVVNAVNCASGPVDFAACRNGASALVAACKAPSAGPSPAAGRCAGILAAMGAWANGAKPGGLAPSGSAKPGAGSGGTKPSGVGPSTGRGPPSNGGKGGGKSSRR